MYQQHYEILKIKLQKGRLDELKNKRINRINEAINFETGTRNEPKKHIIYLLPPNNIEIFFLKPGKEVFRKNPNLYDMTPVIGYNDEVLTFDKIFAIILKIGLTDEIIFKELLVLIYRIAYMIDFEEMSNNKIRFRPNEEIKNIIKEMEISTKDNLPNYGLFSFLCFLDLLGWNEDVKYHIINNQPYFGKEINFMTGRLNTLLSCIAIPYMGLLFINEVLKYKNNKQNIDHNSLLSIIQRLLKSRGICTPNYKELIEWLNPYIYE